MLEDRRNLLRRLAVGVPAVLAGLQLAGATAHADDDDGDDHDRRGPNRGRGRGVRVEVENERREAVTFSADLVPTNTISGDFGAGAGDTGSGSLAVFSSGGSANSISVRLRGANANTTYTLVFQPVNGSRTGSLGTLTTNAAGNATAFFNGALGESGSATSNGLGTRVGVFVLTRSAGDAFVTAA
jgi:hypothetical protein